MFEKHYLHMSELNLAIFNNCQKIIIKNSVYFKVFLLLLMILIILSNGKSKCDGIYYILNIIFGNVNSLIIELIYFEYNMVIKIIFMNTMIC